MNKDSEEVGENFKMANSADSLTFTSVVHGHIFYDGFENFTKNNRIEFKNDIAFIYGANGTGKTSLLKVLSKLKGTTYKCEYSNKAYETKGKESLFHTIQDQNARNIIEGEVNDYLIGSNIKEEQELKNAIDEKYRALRDNCISILKEYGIKTKELVLSEYLNQECVKLFSDLANSRSKGSNYTFEKFCNFLKSTNSLNNNEKKDELEFIISDTKDKNSVIVALFDLEKTFPQEPISDVENIESRNEAIRILNRFRNKHKCVICDTTIDPSELLKRKEKEQEALLNSLPTELKDFLEKLFERVVTTKDPFNIKATILEAIKLGKENLLEEVVGNIKKGLEVYQQSIVYQFAKALSSSGLENMWNTYQDMLKRKPDFSDEDMQIIEEIINNNMRHRIEFKRDEKTQNWHIVLYEDKSKDDCSKIDLLGTKREELFLSTGEQNFISLAFEFLKARNSGCPIVVIDDPVSSFDSIYKNKVIFALLSILREKKTLVLTHNLDVIYLADGQKKGCRNLYLFNNTENGENGFISINDQECQLLINLKNLLTFFRGEVLTHLSEDKLKFFLMAMIPFMRGFAGIIGNDDTLSSVMHGYENQKVDLKQCYCDLFKIAGDSEPGKSSNGLNWNKLETLPKDDYQISVSDILQLKSDPILTETGFKIFDGDDFPLLNRTLRHSLVYLYLRLLVEKTLTNKYPGKYPQILSKGNLTLGDIINRAFPNSSKEKKRFRIGLQSKKVLLNDFNHFENDLSIFQPAIDVTDQALSEEKDAIEAILKQIEDYKDEE